MTGKRVEVAFESICGWFASEKPCDNRLEHNKSAIMKAWFFHYYVSNHVQTYFLIIWDNQAPRLIASPWMIITFPKCGSVAAELKVDTCRVKSKGDKPVETCGTHQGAFIKVYLTTLNLDAFVKELLKHSVEGEHKCECYCGKADHKHHFGFRKFSCLPTFKPGGVTPARMPAKTRNSRNRIGLWMKEEIILIFIFFVFRITFFWCSIKK